MIKSTISIFVFMIACVAFGQNYNKHKVVKGETINQIAQKYNVTPYAIYQLNPDAQNGLKPKTVLLIPKKASVKKTNSKVITHKVEPKETLFGIEKKYEITDEALKKANPDVEKLGLQIGQTLVIPSNTIENNIVSTAEKIVYHEVLPKETKYSVAKKYGISIEELEKKNPEIIPNLTIGYQLIIKGIPPKTDKVTVLAQKETKTITPKINYIDYVVKPKETLYGLSKMAGLEQNELIQLNPNLVNGVEIGMIIKVPESSSIPKEVEMKKGYTSLSKKSNERKKLVLLLPFNINKIEGDTVNSATTRLKKDKFLNMTLDFYSGVMVAIDSAKSLGMPIDVKIFDSQETKSSSNISNIIKVNNLETAHAIIGPFYQNNIETTAQLLGKNNVPIISPLSKDTGNFFPNLYQTIPTTDSQKTAMFDYMKSKGGNIIDVIDKKKETSRQYINQYQKGVKVAALLENGNLSVENLKSLFVKDKINYVILETGNTVMIKATIKTMVESMINYKVQLVVLETNETLETDEIQFENLIKLKLMYPSINRNNETPEALVFKNNFRKKNKIFPNTYAIRGFDVTFDTMMRLLQDKNYQEIAHSVATEQVDNKFDYYKNENGAYANKGVYILYYDTDLTIKEAN